MDLSDATKVQVLRIEQSQQDEKQQVLESAISTVSAVKRLLTEYDRVKDERANFERELACALAENETLRRQAKEARDHRDHFSKALTVLTAQMDAIGTRCIEAAKMARSQRTATIFHPAEQSTVPSTPAAPSALPALPGIP